ncbi:MAG: hypothetical protein R2932_50365 [Caldilineaceae bacterium]
MLAELVAATPVSPVNFGMWREDGRQIVTVARGGQIALWDVDTLLGQIPPIPLTQASMVIATPLIQIWDVDWDQETDRIAIGGSDGLVGVWDLQHGQELFSQSIHQILTLSVQWDPHKQSILSVGADDQAILTDPQSGEILQQFDVAGGLLAGAFFSKDGTKVVTYGGDAVVRIWDVQSGKLLDSLRGHAKGEMQAHWNKTEDALLTAGADGNAIVWNVANAARQSSFVTSLLSGHNKQVWSATTRLYDAYWNRYDSRIVTVSDDRTARLWTVKNGETLAVLPHNRSVLVAAWSRDGSRLATGDGGTVSLWAKRQSLFDSWSCRRSFVRDTQTIGSPNPDNWSGRAGVLMECGEWLRRWRIGRS